MQGFSQKRFLYIYNCLHIRTENLEKEKYVEVGLDVANLSNVKHLNNFEGFTIMFFKAENADQRKTFFLDNFTTWGWKNVYFISVDLQLTILV